MSVIRKISFKCDVFLVSFRAVTGLTVKGREQVDTIHLVFQKAFDKLPHEFEF